MIYKNTFPQPEIGFPKILRWKCGLGPPKPKRPALAAVAATPLPNHQPDLNVILKPDPEAIQVARIQSRIS